MVPMFVTAHRSGRAQHIMELDILFYVVCSRVLRLTFEAVSDVELLHPWTKPPACTVPALSCEHHQRANLSGTKPFWSGRRIRRAVRYGEWRLDSRQFAR